MTHDKYVYWPESTLIKHFCQYRGKTRHGDSALFNKDQKIIFRYNWIDGYGQLADSADGISVTSVCDYANNRRNGYRDEFYNYTMDQIKSRTSYRDDLKHGPHLTFYQDGECESVGNYFMGKLHGNYTYYFHTSGVNQDIPEYEQWPVRETINYSRGNKDGYRRVYDRDGNCVLNELYREGILEYSYTVLSNHAIGLTCMSPVSYTHLTLPTKRIV